jgi:hypothetical protein
MPHVTDVRTLIASATGGDSVDADPVTVNHTSLPNWCHAIPATAIVAATQHLADVDGNPVTYTGLGSVAIPPLFPTAALTIVDVVLAPVPTTTVTGMLSLPPDLVSITKSIVLQHLTGGMTLLQPSSGFCRRCSSTRRSFRSSAAISSSWPSTARSSRSAS